MIFWDVDDKIRQEKGDNFGPFGPETAPTKTPFSNEYWRLTRQWCPVWFPFCLKPICLWIFFVKRLTRLPQTHLPLYFFLLWNTWTWKAGLRLLLSMRPHVAAAGVWGVSCVYQRQCVFQSVLVVGLVAKNIFGGVRDYLRQSLRIQLFSYSHKFI